MDHPEPSTSVIAIGNQKEGSEDDEYRAYRGSAWQARPQSARLGSRRELWPDVALWDSPLWRILV